MGLQNIGAKYQSISFDKDFIKEIKEHIEHRREYRSIADYARAAIREKIERERYSMLLPTYKKNGLNVQTVILVWRMKKNEKHKKSRKI